MDKEKLKTHIFYTYVSLRVGIAILGLLLLVLLIGVGSCQNIELQSSLSAYYHAYPTDIRLPDSLSAFYDVYQNGIGAQDSLINYAYFHTSQWGYLLRSIFVGLLIAIGISLYLYKGFSKEENIALNFAGVFAIGVAIFPTTISFEGEVPIFQAITLGFLPFVGEHLTLHGICAVLLVALIGYVCIWRKEDSLKYLRDDDKRKKRFVMWYRVLGNLMIFLPLGIALLTIIKGSIKVILYIEIFVLLIFVTYWLVKTYEISLTHADHKAIDGSSRV